MSSSRNLVVHIAIIVFVFHGITSGDHVKKWLRLPNVIASPHIKNQSLTVCTGKNYVSLSTEASPRHVKCGLPFSLYIHMIPTTDIVYLQCKGFMKWNGIVRLSKFWGGFCESKCLDCPLIKGNSYTLKWENIRPFYCYLERGHYSFAASCSDQNDQEVACGTWRFTWN
ncbi:uncharacterized protein LOC110252876 [Exaiptasia diaphana]|uniref:S-protein homolog n=1 Tax=Exaiptasia diaphana TaxID=2652724 RepID=A0A913Y692_EXADI|nr:uncharacterized protein LOC110252876 [Exaiptasia diaphana]